ncbi:SRR1-like protein [Holothuria leucospilota]|uniref:SRR1-like protein n=1 Tax=Holothuria leucospilota TaxID=206669 RepID=A0A9Q1HE48_HOLLE|nr:SRR1-like protein [Holothuria leucospilota]
MASGDKDADGFQIVKKRGRKNNRANKPTTSNHVINENFDFEAFKVKLWQTRQELKPSNFIKDFKETWKEVQTKFESDPAIVKLKESYLGADVDEDVNQGISSCLPPELLKHLGNTSSGSDPKKNEVITSIVCYGLGNFSSCVTARYQLGFLLLLSNMIQEGKRHCTQPTLFFMPHCGKPLYNNLLWANWGHTLNNLIILGNRFSSFLDRQPESWLLSEAVYISMSVSLILSANSLRRDVWLKEDELITFSNIQNIDDLTRVITKPSLNSYWSNLSADNPNFCDRNRDQQLTLPGKVEGQT